MLCGSRKRFTLFSRMLIKGYIVIFIKIIYLFSSYMFIGKLSQVMFQYRRKLCLLLIYKVILMCYIKEVYDYIYYNFYITIEFILSESYAYNVILKMRMLFYILYVKFLFIRKL